jgi:diazepam-binding inhibitor (GABA receptor modulating acyl-CoA-binding protein)
MALPDDFRAAVDRAQQLTRRPNNEKLLELYALFKQSTEGDVSGERPTGFDFKGIAKYDAWASKKGMTSETAMQAYLSLVNALEQNYK